MKVIINKNIKITEYMLKQGSILAVNFFFFSVEVFVYWYTQCSTVPEIHAVMERICLLMQGVPLCHLQFSLATCLILRNFCAKDG